MNLYNEYNTPMGVFKHKVAEKKQSNLMDKIYSALVLIFIMGFLIGVISVSLFMGPQG